MNQAHSLFWCMAGPKTGRRSDGRTGSTTSAATGACCCCRTRRSIRPRSIMPRSGSRIRANSPAFPNLRVIFNLGAGVDALMADSSLPDVPLVRVAVPDLTERMTEYVVLHVLMHHRQELYLRESQREKRWAPKSQWAGERDLGRHHGARHARRQCRRRAAAASAFAWPAGAAARSRSTASNASTAKRQLERVPAADRHPGLPAAADAGHAAHPQSRPVRKTQPQQPARRAGADQCRPRRLAERSRHSALPRRRHAGRRLARRLRAGAAAGRTARSGPIRRWC